MSGPSPNRPANFRAALPFAYSFLVVPIVAVMAMDSVPAFVPWIIPWILLPLFPYLTLTEKLVKKEVPTLDQNTPLARLFWHTAILWCWAISYPLLLILVIWSVCNSPTLIVFERLSLLMLFGQLSVFSIIVAHDLVHRQRLWARRLGELVMGAIALPHWYTEHLYVHHRHVGTPLDRETAPAGRTFYAYFWRVALGSYVDAVNVQHDRLARRGLSFWHRSNPVWRWAGTLIGWIALAFLVGEWLGIGVWLFLALFASYNMRAADYVQHYGLQRILQSNGRYETIQPHHSWNYSSSSNYPLFSIQRHSDHHDSPRKPYPLLSDLPATVAPRLPANYAAMCAIALFPSVWFRRMNPLVESWRRRFYPNIDDWRALSSAAYRRRPGYLPSISEIIAGSPRLSEYMERHYPLLDSIEGREFQRITIPHNIGMDRDERLFAQRGLLRLYYTREFGFEEMMEDFELGGLEMTDDIPEVVQTWCNDQAFQLGVRVMRGHVPPDEAALPLSNLADVGITQIARAVVEDYISYRGPVTGSGIAVVALGRLGDRRMIFESAADLVVIGDAAAAEADRFNLDTSGDELCKRMNDLFAAFSHNNLLLRSVRVRRPTPEAGTRVVSGSIERLASANFVSDTISPLQEVAPARIVYATGDRVRELRQRFDEARRTILLRHASAVAAGGRPSAGTTGANRSLHDILSGPGGLDDLELAALRMRLRHIGMQPDAMPEGGLASLFEKSGESEIAEAAKLLLRLECVLSLTAHGAPDEAQWEDSVKATVTRACDETDFEAVAAKARDATARVVAHLDAPVT